MTDATRKQQFLACLSDPSRFNLLATLAGGPRCVTELAGLVGLSQSCTTRHLQALQREGIVIGERRGKRVVFSLGDPGPEARPVLSWAFGTLIAPADERPFDPSSASRPGATAGSMGAPDGAGRHRTRRARGPAGVRALSADAPIEITDALVVAHDAGWESDDRGEVSEGLPASRSTGEPEGRASNLRAGRADLDDFLL